MPGFSSNTMRREAQQLTASNVNAAAGTTSNSPTTAAIT
ncbi:unnamed protein product [Anisakis simplex]|uniref:Uncharacterized protein n=1 Tax=Anisakis simplex TaxID=6269 RepID=A0A3P6RXP5_ANISI|nr:unnamed protein product [Anisakis simplex]